MKEIYVSTNGNDSNNGSKNAPFKTLTRARNEARKCDGATVFVEEGRYFFTDTFELSKEDSNTTYKALGKVYFDGGVVIDNSDIKDYDGKIKVVDLSKYDINIGEYGARGFRRSYTNSGNELFVNSDAYVVARYPKKGLIKFKEGDIIEPGSNVKDGDYSQKCAVLKLGKENVSKWKDAKDAYIGGYPAHAWADDCMKIAEYDTENGTITTIQPHLFSYRVTGHSGWYIVNLIEELTEEGEYYVDTANKKLYFIPKCDIKDAFIQLSSLDKVMIAIEDANNVTIEGITIENSRNSGIYIENGDSCTIKDCVFRNLGIIAIQFGQGAEPQPHGLNNCHGKRAESVPVPKPISREAGSNHEYLYEFAAWDNNAGTNHLVSGCHIYNMGAGGILLSGGNRKTLTPANNTVYNCHIHHVNRLDQTYRACVDIKGVGNSIKNCEIHDTPSIAILLHGNDHIIEYCKIYRTCTENSDSGAIYMGRDPSEVGNIIRYNFIYDIINTIPTGLGVAAIYFDDYSIYNCVYGNFFYNIVSGGTVWFSTVYHNGGGMTTIANNIFIDCKPGLNPNSRTNSHDFMHTDPIGIMRTSAKEDDMHGVDVTSNIYKEKYPYLYKTYTEDYHPDKKFWHNLTLFEQYGFFEDQDPTHLNFKFAASCYEKSGLFNWCGPDQRVTDEVFGIYNENRKMEAVDFEKIGLVKDNYIVE